MAFQLCRWTCAFLQDTGDKEAKVSVLTMVDNSSGQMVAMAVQKKGHDKFVERFLVERSRVIRSGWRDGASDGQRNRTDRCGKTRGSLKKSDNRHQTDSQEKQPTKRVP